MSSTTRITDECLWLKHISEGPVRDGLASMIPGGRIWLTVDEVPVLFERMASGSDGRQTFGFKPVGDSAAEWRARYVGSKGAEARVSFLGSLVG